MALDIVGDDGQRARVRRIFENGKLAEAEVVGGLLACGTVRERVEQMILAWTDSYLHPLNGRLYLLITEDPLRVNWSQ